MAHYAQTVNVIGCIKTTKTDAFFSTTALPLLLYRQHFGAMPVATTAPAPFDVMAALDEDGKTLTIGIVNPTTDPAPIELKLTGATLAGEGRRWHVAGEDPMAFNEPGGEPKVTIEAKTVRDASDKLEVAPCSVTLYSLKLK